MVVSGNLDLHKTALGKVGSVRLRVSPVLIYVHKAVLDAVTARSMAPALSPCEVHKATILKRETSTRCNGGLGVGRGP